jgi:hypothetical protein
MLKSSAKILLKGYQKPFNLLIESGKFPDQWCEGLITPIFKSGDKTNPNNYRGICVTICLSKFLCIVLNERLSKFSPEQNLMHRSQIGFQSGHSHRTADHIFILKTLGCVYFVCYLVSYILEHSKHVFMYNKPYNKQKYEILIYIYGSYHCMY